MATGDYVRFKTNSAKDSGAFLASKEDDYTPTNIKAESYEQDGVTVKTNKVAISPGSIYFTADGKIIYDIDDNTRIIMSDRVNSARTADYAVYANLAESAENAVTAQTAEDASYADAASIATTVNGIAYYTDTHGAFGNIATSANGGLYTDSTGNLQFDTLPISVGGTGASSFTANEIIKYVEPTGEDPHFISIATNPSIEWEAPPQNDSHKIPALRISVLGENNNSQAYANVKMPEASTTLAGVITPTAQDLAGDKILNGNLQVDGNFTTTIAYNGSHNINVANHIGYHLESNYLIEGNYTNATSWQGLIHNFSNNQTIGGLTFSEPGEYLVNKNLTKITGKDIILTNKFLDDSSSGSFPTIQLHKINVSAQNDTNNITMTADYINNNANLYANTSAPIINLTTASSATLVQSINLNANTGLINLTADTLGVNTEDVNFNILRAYFTGEGNSTNYIPTKFQFNNYDNSSLVAIVPGTSCLQIAPSMTSTVNQITLNVNGASNFPTGITMGAASAITTDTLTVARNPEANMEVATKQYVDQSFAINDALLFKGIVSATSDLPTPENTYSAGWTYKVSVITPTLIAGEYCESGDLLIAIKDRPLTTDDGYNGTNQVVNADWVKVQNNVDGAVFVASSASNPNRQVGDPYTPVYIDELQPVAMNPLQKKSFSIGNGDTSVTLSHAAYTADTYVVMINITSGENNINGAISWTSSNGSVTLTTAATSGPVSGYILTSRATNLD